jgi:PHD/YefM family antitoxin component YafN of YafNO toxin-antitoxin module
MITRHGKPAALMMDPAELERLIATLDILSDPDMMKQIERSKREFAAGKYKTYASDEELDELFGPS